MIPIELIDKFFRFGKNLIMIFFTFYTTLKIMDKTEIKEKRIFTYSLILLIAIFYNILRYKNGQTIAISMLNFLIALLIIKITNNDFIYSVICTLISYVINSILLSISTTLMYILNEILNIQNKHIIVILIMIGYILLMRLFFNIKKIRKGFSFLNKSANNDYFQILLFNISAITLFCFVLLINYNRDTAESIVRALIIFAIIMFITIQKSLQLYYKQKLLIKELNETKEELAKKTKEVEDLESENLSISKKAHTLDHKQKSLAKKIDEMLLNTEISKEEVAEVKERLNKIGKDLYKEKTTVELSKTGIAQIDDMLSYMQSECAKNKIDFELQLKGNIYYMTNNLISIEDLETLLADHIKNAIIAINHTDNINRSILVRLGEIDGFYSLYIYDSGVEFSKETLENLGKKPSTTHADEGGTGMGFMNTFDTLRKCKASLIIEEIGEPTKDDYTKAIIIKFDNKNEFKIIHKKCYNCG